MKKDAALTCTIEFVPNASEGEYHVVIGRESKRGFVSKTEEFSDLNAALKWVQKMFPKQLAAWQASQKPIEKPKPDMAETGTIYFITDPSQIPEAERMRKEHHTETETP
ncbi:MAG: hypothetical protein MN733_35310 [Nitrososphaera sp.]|nr:hypothetical protein [Nitrososphaera sp.]